MKDLGFAALCVCLLLALLLVVPQSLQALVFFLLFPGAMAAFFVQSSPHGGTGPEVLLGLVLLFVVNTPFYALLIAGVRRLWNNRRRHEGKQIQR